MLIPPDPLANIDYLFDSDNDYGIPRLKSYMQARGLVLPFEIWGAKPRGQTMAGTYGLYVYDDFLNPLWRNPWKLWESGCNAIFEPNFTIGKDMPRAVVLYQIYRKRWLSRFWGEQGIKVFIDLNVPFEYEDLMLLGVSVKEWGSYCTRGYENDGELIIRQFEFIEKLSGNSFKDGELIGVVYGGGQKMRVLCREKGLIYVEQWMERGSSGSKGLDLIETPDKSLLSEGYLKLRKRKEAGLGLLKLLDKRED